jgi:hypothetical protein
MVLFSNGSDDVDIIDIELAEGRGEHLVVVSQSNGYVV